MLKQFEKWYLPFGFLLVAFLYWEGAWLAYSQGKWLGLHFIGMIALALMVIRGPLLPKLPRWQTAAILLIFSGMLAQLFYFQGVGYAFALIDRLSFLLVLLGAWAAFRQQLLRWEDFWWPLAAVLTVVSLIGLYQLWQVGFPGEMPYQTVGSTFGHTNNTAQALGLCLLLWWGMKRVQSPLWLQPAVSVLALTYFFFLRGRSTLIGFAIALVLLASLRYRREGLRFFRRRGVIAAGAMVLVLFTGLQLAKGKSVSELVRVSILGEKSSMVLWRADVWKQTVAMIQAHPLGVGPDRFAFAFVPFHSLGTTFRENNVAQTPHNEVLRYLAEDGVILAPLYFLLVMWVFVSWLRRREEWLLLLPAAVFLAVEAVTQFPFNNPFPSYCFALALGYMGSRIWGGGQPPKNRYVRAGLSFFLALYLILEVRVVIARTFEHSPSLGRSDLSCRMVPHNWHSCLMKAKHELDGNLLSQARITAEEILYSEPWNFTAMRYLSIIAFKQGDQLEGCFHLWRYNHLYRYGSSVEQPLKHNCQPKWIAYFDRKKPPVYVPQYQAYLERKKSESIFSTLRFWE